MRTVLAGMQHYEAGCLKGPLGQLGAPDVALPQASTLWPWDATRGVARRHPP